MGTIPGALPQALNCCAYGARQLREYHQHARSGCETSYNGHEKQRGSSPLSKRPTFSLPKTAPNAPMMAPRIEMVDFHKSGDVSRYRGEPHHPCPFYLFTLLPFYFSIKGRSFHFPRYSFLCQQPLSITWKSTRICQQHFLPFYSFTFLPFKALFTFLLFYLFTFQSFFKECKYFSFYQRDHCDILDIGQVNFLCDCHSFLTFL